MCLCSEFDDYFGIAVAGFPEGHPNSRESPEMEITHLKVNSCKIEKYQFLHDKTVCFGCICVTVIFISGQNCSWSRLCLNSILLRHGYVYQIPRSVSCGQHHVSHHSRFSKPTRLFTHSDPAGHLTSHHYYSPPNSALHIDIYCVLCAGMMPIQSYSSFQRMTSFCRTTVPKKVWEDLKPIRENDEAVKCYGVELARKMCTEMMDAGIQGFHFYT